MKIEMQKIYLRSLELGNIKVIDDTIFIKNNQVVVPNCSNNRYFFYIKDLNKYKRLYPEYVVWFSKNHEILDVNSTLIFKNGIISDFRYENLILKKYVNKKLEKLRIDTETINEILKLFEHKIPIKKIAEIVNIEYKKVYSIIIGTSETAYDRKIYASTRLSEDNINKILSMAYKKMSIRKISDETGFSYNTVKKILIASNQ